MGKTKAIVSAPPDSNCQAKIADAGRGNHNRWRPPESSRYPSTIFLWRAGQLANSVFKEISGAVIHCTSPVSPGAALFPHTRSMRRHGSNQRKYPLPSVISLTRAILISHATLATPNSAVSTSSYDYRKTTRRCIASRTRRGKKGLLEGRSELSRPGPTIPFVELTHAHFAQERVLKQVLRALGYCQMFCAA